jgi:tRNA A-37 threonylcarbamoyl transferase component Bud32
MEFEIKGHSGCRVIIENATDGSGLYVIKSTDDRTYTQRLLNQADKQIAFFEKKIIPVKIPQIFEITENKHGVAVKMEFIYSSNFVDYFEKTDIAGIDAFIQTIIDLIDAEIYFSPVKEVESKIIADKYENVKEIILKNTCLRNNDCVNDILTKTDSIFKIRNTIELPVGLCHGDLTLSNILFNGQKLCLVDFLDSFIETPLADIVKIRQDTHFAWSLLMYTKSCDIPRMKMILTYIDTKLNNHYIQYAWYRNLYLPFQLLNLLRVLQYAKIEKVIDFLLQATLKVIHEISSINE